MLYMVLLLPGLLLVSLQDFKYREVYWWVFPYLIAVSIWFNQSLMTIESVTYNSIFMLIQLISVVFYLLLKNRKKNSGSLKGYLGLGDILFFIVLIVSFSALNFVVYYMLSLFVAALATTAYNFFTHKKVTVPLAGIQSAGLILLLIICNIYDFSPFNDTLLMSMLYGR